MDRSPPESRGWAARQPDLKVVAAVSLRQQTRIDLEKAVDFFAGILWPGPYYSEFRALDV